MIGDDFSEQAWTIFDNRSGYMVNKWGFYAGLDAIRHLACRIHLLWPRRMARWKVVARRADDSGMVDSTRLPTTWGQWCPSYLPQLLGENVEMESHFARSYAAVSFIDVRSRSFIVTQRFRESLREPGNATDVIISLHETCYLVDW